MKRVAQHEHEPYPTDHILGEFFEQLLKVVPSTTQIRRIDSLGYYQLDFDTHRIFKNGTTASYTLNQMGGIDSVVYIIERIRESSEDWRPDAPAPLLLFSASLEFPPGPRVTAMRLNITVKNEARSLFCRWLASCGGHATLLEALHGLHEAGVTTNIHWAEAQPGASRTP